MLAIDGKWTFDESLARFQCAVPMERSSSTIKAATGKVISVVAFKPLISLTLKRKPAKKTYIVGLDGSTVCDSQCFSSRLRSALTPCAAAFAVWQLALRAVQVAAFMLDQYNDNLVILTLGRQASDKTDIFDRFVDRAKSIAIRSGVLLDRLYCEYVELPETFKKFDDALVYLGNHESAGGAILVMGAAGKGDEAGAKKSSRPGGQPPIGSIALACLQRCKQPVVLVKSGKIPDTSDDRIKRIGSDGTKGLNIMVSMDMSDVSRKAFDTALTFGTKGRDRKSDSIFLFHVQQSGDEKLVEEYSVMQDKLKDEYTSVTWCSVDKSGDIHQQIDKFIDDNKIDVVVMGSIELSDIKKGQYFGSVSSAVAKSSSAHCVVVKTFPYTW